MKNYYRTDLKNVFKEACWVAMCFNESEPKYRGRTTSMYHVYIEHKATKNTVVFSRPTL